MRISDWSSDVCSSDLAFGSDPRELASGSCTLTEQLAMGALEERRIADCVMAHVFLAAVFGAPGLEDENVGSEQGFDRGQIAAGHERKRVGEGRRRSVRLEPGGRRHIKTKSN